MTISTTTKAGETKAPQPENSKKFTIYSSLITLFTLLGGLAVGLISGSLTHFGLPDSMNETIRIGISALPGLFGAFLGGMLWGWIMARIVAPDHSRRASWAGGIGFGLPFIVVALVLTALEVLLVQEKRTELPIHIVFTILFVPAAAIIAASGAFALGTALRSWKLGSRLALSAGLTAALAFLIVVLLMDLLFGYRVGAPGAAERATMVTVLFVGIVVCSLAGGAAIGRMVFKIALGNQ
ncbi:MAG: hypothetical protein R3293_23550 [Candidatus Promineifilaceae bacterium]|nr:hypothetical protein [Candidatus Promineifilaceae bacterium]